MTDWYPTLLKLADIDDEITDTLDGVDQYEALFQHNEDLEPRDEVINEIGTAGLSGFRGAYQNSDGWKLLRNPRYSTVYDNFFLFNVRDDPSETTDYKEVYPELYDAMRKRFEVGTLYNSWTSLFMERKFFLPIIPKWGKQVPTNLGLQYFVPVHAGPE